MRENKSCSRCKEEKSVSEFYISKGRISSACKSCKSDMYKDWEKRNPEKRKEIHSKHYEKTARWHVLKYKYGISKQEYEAMLFYQDGKCAICYTTNSRHNKSNNLLVDHCHDSLKIRGLLCNRCNTALGLINDETSILKRMIEYLNK